ncbi:alpha/beta hydrolase [Flavobacterium orientale]|uniref:Alpha/beta hydrolase n=2 Tax=Flavobacterium orientale TaxID=1756020 RepID=A0A916Y1G5_9FLAO|nr:alpha/beta hydrolase [Flavobacterium orientale]
MILVNFVQLWAQDYQQDKYLDSFQMLTVAQPDDYEGKVTFTLVSKLADEKSNKAVLYIHGYCDYFFQEEYAEQFTKRGINFYALDLRKYGRSYLPHQVIYNMRSLEEYFPDIDSALEIIKKEGNDKVLLNAHSTGGLISSLYANQRKDSPFFDAIFLNSPFLEMNMSWFKRKAAIPLIAKKGLKKPNKTIKGSSLSFYGESLHKDYRGEWDYDLSVKPIVSPNVTYGFIRALYLGHNEIKNRLHITQPILVMHSDKSIQSKSWREDFYYSDSVLDVGDIEKYSYYLGNQVKTIAIKDGMHDLVLSRTPVRNEVYRNLFDWLDSISF